MRIILDEGQQINFFKKFEELKIKSKLRRWRWKSNKTGWGKRYDYVEFSGKEIPHEKLITLLDALENRYRLSLYCLEEIRKECEVLVSDNIPERNELRKKFENRGDIETNFLLKCEYFIFAIDSSLESMAHFINIVYDLCIEENKVSIGSVLGKLKHKSFRQKRDKFAVFLSKNNRSWIREFKDLRNRMTHHQIIQFLSELNHDYVNKKTTYTKHLISAKIYDFTKKRRLVKIKEIKKPLPEYFDFIVQNYQQLKSEFYKKLSSII